mgnify:FL=1
MKTSSQLSPFELESLLNSVDDFGNRSHPFKKGIRAAKFFSAGIFYTIDDTDKINILICQYQEDGTGPIEYRFPGGSSEPNEDPRYVLNRESREETGLIPTCYEPVFHSESRDKNFSKWDYKNHHHKFFFAISIWAGCMKKSSDLEGGEVKGFQWVTLEKCKEMLHGRHMDAFNAFCEDLGKRFLHNKVICKQLPSYS